MKRRDAIKALGTLAGAASMSQFLSACANDGDGGPQGITTMVFMMMENRSYDHYLGARSWLENLPGNGLVDGMSNPNTQGELIAPFPTTADTYCTDKDPPHGWDPSRVQFDDGANDGFVLAQEQKHGAGSYDPMQYMKREHLPVTWALADAYTSCDRWHCSLLGPTLPNRMYWHAATSNGATNNQQVLEGAFEGVTTIYHRLSDAGVDWGYYYGDVPVLSVGLGDFPNIEDYVHRFMYDFLDDAAAGTLPPIVYIDPNFSANDDHPPHHPLLGQQLISTVYTALATSPQWNNCLLVLAYDENGGFFDHMAPPTTADERAADGFGQMGFRVPTIVAGPYAKQGYVSSVLYDHCSALKHIENVHGLETLNERTAAANDLVDCIDLERLANNDPLPPIELPAVDIDETTLPDHCKAGADIRELPSDHDVHVWADTPEGMRRLGKKDLRRERRDYIYAIGDYLDKHDLGRIKRSR